MSVAYSELNALFLYRSIMNYTGRDAVKIHNVIGSWCGNFIKGIATRLLFLQILKLTKPLLLMVRATF